ncbi:MAG: hypothetical protein ACD_50C00280G0003 [uncultured bacterium]|nr:MAG: hypothetical protein ACD_50C00280G0003 [uncultured bacterium]OGH14359.1 MAG: hypothetical protein A2687_01895 [Candidatus Levybacteria bacterium RIFCSPHIGHO2_01_FULL_38_26]
MKTSIVIVTYNSERFVDKLIKSIYEFNKTSDYEIIIVDNNSADSTLKKAQRYSRKFKVLENKANLGFAKGCNIGAKAAEGKYILFLNPDAQWRRGSLENLISVFDKDEQVGVVGGKILTKEGKEEKSVGKFLGTFEIFLMSLGLDELLGIRYSPNKLSEVDFVSGGFMMVKRELFEKFLGFDENFFMYVEDMDFCFRIKRNGYKVYFCPDVAIIHEGQGSSNRSFAIKNIHKGLIYFHKKHGNVFSYLFTAAMLWSKSLALVMQSRIRNNKKYLFI